MKVGYMWVISRGISSDWVASLSLGDISREWSCLLKALKPGALDQPEGGYCVPAQQSFRSCWWVWPLPEMHGALISAVNLCKSEPLCETYPQPREAQIQTHTHFMKTQLQAGTRAYILRGWRHRTHFQLFPQLCLLKHLYPSSSWAGEVRVLSALSPLYLNVCATLQYQLYRNR